MLGLSQGVSSSSFLVTPADAILSYSSDFSSSVDGFEGWDLQSSQVDPDVTLTSGVDFGGKTDVLKITWSANEAIGFFQIRKSFSELDDQDNRIFTIVFSADIYYDFTTSGDLSTFVQAGHQSSGSYTVVNNTDVAQDQWVTISDTKVFSGSQLYDEYLYIGFVDADDKPQSGDEMYVTNISFTIL